MEHRCSTRISCRLPVAVELNDRELDDCHILNVSADGVLLECAGVSLPRGTTLRIGLPAIDPEGVPVWVPGLVVHAGSGRVGVWLGEETDERHRLLDYLCRHLGEDPRDQT